MTEVNKKLVFHPAHYSHEGRRECWDEMIELFGMPAVIIFDVLSAYKYFYRSGTKEGNAAAQDDAKIDNYMEHAKGLIASHWNPRSRLFRYATDIYHIMTGVLRIE